MPKGQVDSAGRLMSIFFRGGFVARADSFHLQDGFLEDPKDGRRRTAGRHGGRPSRNPRTNQIRLFIRVHLCPSVVKQAFPLEPIPSVPLRV